MNLGRGVLLILCLILGSCQPKEIGKSMYWWRTTFNPNETEMAFLKSHQIKRLYIRLFDVDMANGQPIPLGSLNVPQVKAIQQEIVPTIFMKSRVFEQIAPQDTTSLQILAQQIEEKMRFHEQSQFTKSFANEIQIDCDWSVKAKGSYFYFLKALKKRNPNRQISITLRLYPYRNEKLLGIPPADRAMLMVYHVSNFKDFNSKNSLYSEKGAMPYVMKIASYPLPIDIALPAFSWGILFRYGKFEQLVSGFTHEKAKKLRFLEKDTALENFYKVKQDTLFNEVFLRQGDKIRVEQLTEQELLQAAQQSQKAVNQKSFNVSLFHLDATYLSSYTHENVAKVFDSFR